MFVWCLKRKREVEHPKPCGCGYFCNDPVLEGLGVSEMMICVVHFCALTHGIKFGTEFADAICLCCVSNTCFLQYEDEPLRRILHFIPCKGPFASIALQLLVFLRSFSLDIKTSGL